MVQIALPHQVLINIAHIHYHFTLINLIFFLNQISFNSYFFFQANTIISQLSLIFNFIFINLKI